VNADDAPQSLAELDQWFAAVDTMNEADPGVRHAGKDVIRVGQAALNALNARRGKK
jgi:hypothetical protein